MKPKEKEFARKLRLDGKSITHIADILQVSKSSVSLWVKDIVLSTEQKENLSQLSHQGSKNGVKTILNNREKTRQKYRNEGKQLAKKQEFLHGFVCALYWGEGLKNQNHCMIVNSDIALLKMFMSFLKEYFPDKKVKAQISCYLNNGLAIEDITQYWSSNLGLSMSDFIKPFIKDHTNQAPERNGNSLPYGTLSLRVCNGMSVVQHILGAIEEYGETAFNIK